MSSTTSATSPAPTRSDGQPPWLPIARGMYALNVVAAGLPGAIMTFAPGFAADELFVGEQDPMVFSILGAVWLAIGMVSVLGLRDPRRYLGVFAVQAVYKSVWIATGGLRLIGPRPDVLPYVVGFAVVTVGFVAALVLAGRDEEVAR